MTKEVTTEDQNNKQLFVALHIMVFVDVLRAQIFERNTHSGSGVFGV